MNRLDRMSWHKVKLGDYITILTDYHANGSYEILKKNVELLDEPDYAVMIRTTNFEKQDFSQNLKYISRHAYEFLSKSKVKPGDILMNKIANAGSVYYMPDFRCPVSLGMNLFLIRTDPNKINQRYAYYYLKTNEDYVKLFATGTAAKTITKEAVRQLDISLPPIDVQHKIVSILSTCDDLIENNLRRIKILEEVAQNLYREWFVKLRFPGHQKVKMVNSPLGKIPEGWDVSALGSLCTLIKEPYREELHASFPLIDLARIPQKTLLASEVGSPKELSTSRIIFSADDVLFGAIRPYLHKVVLAPTNGVTNVSVFVVRSREEILKPFLAILLSMEDAVRWADQYSTGTKMPVIKWDVFQQMKVLIPKKEVIRGFYDGVWPMMQSVKNTFTRNSNLRQTRDLLLPKLISGEVDVSELDVTIPEANA